MRQHLDSAEIQLHRMHRIGQALRAVSDLQRHDGTAGGNTHHARRDDLAALMEVLSESVISTVDKLNHIVAQCHNSA